MFYPPDRKNFLFSLSFLRWRKTGGAEVGGDDRLGVDREIKQSVLPHTKTRNEPYVFPTS